MDDVIRKDITICGVPYSLVVVEKACIFTERSGFYGMSMSFTVEKKSDLLYLTDITTGGWASGNVPLCHLIKAKQIAAEHIGDDHSTPVFISPLTL